MRKNSVPQGRLSQVLGMIPKGIKKPVTVAEISQATGISVRNVRKLLRVLLMTYNIPIGGSRSGGRYGIFIATTDEERAAAIAPLANNAKEIQRRVNKLRRMQL